MPYTPKASGGYQGPAIPDGLYVLEVKEVTLQKAKEPDQWGHMKDKLRIRFAILDLEDEDGEPVCIDPLVNNSLSDGSGGRYPASTYWKVCVALGASPESGINSDDLIRLQCKGMIVTEEEEGAWPKITQYARISKAEARAATRQAGGSRPSPAATGPSVAASDPQDELNAWWKKTRDAGLERKEVIEQSKFTYDGREPMDLTTEERETVYQMLNP